MIRIETSAPGKALISGEYAVLRAAPAICMAVDSRAVVRLVEIDGDQHRLTAPGYLEGEWFFSVQPGGEFSWHGSSPGGTLGLLEAAWSSVFADKQPLAALSLELDTRSFHDANSGHKLGLGSSAALTVALVAALAELSGRAELSRQLAFEAHSKFQAQQGSGVDLAAAFNGGLIEYRMTQQRNPKELVWPEGLCYQFVWTGKPVKTTSKLQQFAGVADDSKALQSLQAVSQEIVDKWRTSQANEILGALTDYTQALRRFDRDAELGIFAGGHESAWREAERRQLVYKPCGAGGGDVGIVLGRDEEKLLELEQALIEQGLCFIAAKMDSCGLAVSRRD